MSNIRCENISYIVEIYSPEQPEKKLVEFSAGMPFFSFERGDILDSRELPGSYDHVYFLRVVEVEHRIKQRSEKTLEHCLRVYTEILANIDEARKGRLPV